MKVNRHAGKRMVRQSGRRKRFCFCLPSEPPFWAWCITYAIQILGVLLTLSLIAVQLEK